MNRKKTLNYGILSKIIDRYGSPFYILYKDKLCKNYNTFLDSLRMCYKKTIIAYSYKTNYLPALCSLLHNMGAWAEVMSDFEMDLALLLKVPRDKIIFNGPLKTYSSIEKAFLNKILINLESFEELEIIKEIAKKYKTQYGIGLRLNFELGNINLEGNNRHSRFGFSIEDVSTEEIIEKINSNKYIHIKGFHCHYSTYNKEPKVFDIITKNITNFIIYTYQKYNMIIEFIDIGGNFGSKKYYDGYSRVIGKNMLRLGAKLGYEPSLIVEPGYTLVYDCVDLVAEVMHTKRIKNTFYVVMNTSINEIRDIIDDSNITFYTKHESSEAKIPAKIVGSTGAENDIIAKNSFVPEKISRGDFCLFKNCGAYTLVLSPQFICPRPAAILFDNNKFILIRRKEVLRDVFIRDIFNLNGDNDNPSRMR